MRPSEIYPGYQEEILDWRAARDASIRRENSWLALAGLFWLKEGENRLGSDPSSDILLPPRLPAQLGSIHFDGKQAVLHPETEHVLQVNGRRPGKGPLKSDVEKDPSFITVDGIQMVLIQRAGGAAIRLWDNERSERHLFPSREWFPVNQALRLHARYTRFNAPHEAMLPNVFGEMEPAAMHGQVAFEIDGRTYTLDASEEEDATLSIHFQDLTNRNQTYPSGRYYDTQDPPTDGQVVLDFNYARNPPCAFTPFATCAFAPPGNHLPVSIEAGELYPRR